MDTKLIHFAYMVMGRAGTAPPYGDLEEKHLREAARNALTRLRDDLNDLLRQGEELGISIDAPATELAEELLSLEDQVQPR